MKSAYQAVTRLLAVERRLARSCLQSGAAAHHLPDAASSSADRMVSEVFAMS